MTEKLTKARKEMLEFVAANEPVKLFPLPSPSIRLVRKMADEGLLAKSNSVGFGSARYSLSPAGRTALAKSEGRS